MSGATSRRRGHTYERDLATWLRQRGWEAVTARSLSGGTQAGSDLITNLPVCVEAKNHSALNLAGWVDQAVRDADGDLASVWVKRRGRPLGESYVVMSADQFLELLDGER